MSPDKGDSLEILTTTRLRVRTWAESDLPRLQALLGDPETMAHWPQPLSKAEARAWYDRSVDGMREYGQARWCVERLEDGVIAGDVGLVRMELEGRWINDLGYIIDRQFWRRGYAAEAAGGIIEWARAQGCDAMVATMATDNLPSAATARALGFELVREFNNPRNGNKNTFWFELKLYPDKRA